MHLHRLVGHFLCPLVLTAASALTAPTAEGSTISPIVTNPNNGHRYVLLQNDTWQASEAEAVALGGHLVTISDAAEQNWIFETFAHYGGVNRLLWIGLNDAETEGQFIWSSGEAVTFTGWAPGEPNSIETEDYVAIFYPGHHAENQWNDWGTIRTDPIGLPMNGVVEFTPGVTNITLIPLGSTWRYHDAGVNLASTWRAPDANETGWSSGKAPLGYGDGDEATIIRSGSDPQNKPITTYFRRSFTVQNPEDIARLNLRLLRDDGAVAYLNGTEVYRSNMPEGAIAFDTRASAAAGNEDESVALHTAAISPSLLRAGGNVLAVELHQATPDSSDLSFDLELNALSHAVPAVSITAPTSAETFAAGRPVLLHANAVDDLGIASVEFRINAQFVGRITNSPFQMFWSNATLGIHALIAVAFDTSGQSTTSAPAYFKVGNQLVSEQSTWRYQDTGIAPTADWISPSFDDSSWPSGPAKLGYGEGDESTLIGFGPNSASKHITAWFRQTFTVTDPNSVAGLQVGLRRDDGAVVYINGTEVLRSNLPTNGPVVPSTLALSTVGGSDERALFKTKIPSTVLVAGQNVIAAEVHQSDPASSDLSFALELIGETHPDSPTLLLLQSDDLLTFEWTAASSDWTLEASPVLSQDSQSWIPTGTISSVAGWIHRITIPNDGGTRFFRLRHRSP